jgi:hypothetical protein
MDQLKVLYPEYWPELSGDDNVLYEQEAVTALAERLKNDVRAIVRAFRDYRDNGGRGFLQVFSRC